MALQSALHRPGWGLSKLPDASKEHQRVHHRLENFGVGTRDGEPLVLLAGHFLHLAASDEAGLLVEDDGARVVFPPGFENRDGDPLPLIIQARTGGFNYATSDLTCVIDRVERLGADLMLYVVGAPQQQHLAMVVAVSEMAGWLVPPTEAVHVGFGNVLGADRKMLRSRSGDSAFPRWPTRSLCWKRYYDMKEVPGGHAISGFH